MLLERGAEGDGQCPAHEALGISSAEQQPPTPGAIWGAYPRLCALSEINTTDSFLEFGFSEVEKRPEALLSPSRGRWESLARAMKQPLGPGPLTSVHFCPSCSEGSGHLSHHWHLWRRSRLLRLCDTTHFLPQQEEKTE